MSSATSAGSTRTPVSIPPSSPPSQEWLTRSLSVYQPHRVGEEPPLRSHGGQGGRGTGGERRSEKIREENQINEEQDGVQEEAEEQEQTEKLEKGREEDQ